MSESETMASSLNALLNERRVVLCGGTGGVGKTTAAAALGLYAAKLGINTLVLTIDPARRLADAVGLPEIAATPTRTPLNERLSLMMLDPAQSVDALVSTHAPNERLRERLLNHPVYQQIAATVAGSREFVAMEQLHDLVAEDRYELLIVDTPPAQHALDFLDAPARLMTILDGSGLGFLLRTTSIANRLSFGLVGQSQKQFAKLFEKLTGHRLLVDLAGFYELFESVIDGFKARAETMARLLSSPQVGFVLVQLPVAEGVGRAQAFAQRLRQEEMHLDAVLFNQCLSLQPTPAPPDIESLKAHCGVDEAAADALLACYGYWQGAAQLQRAAIERWRVAAEELSGASVPLLLRVPRFPENVSGAAGLERFAHSLSEGSR